MEMDNLIAIDTETSGVDFYKSQIIQFSALFLDKDFNIVFEKEWNINYKEDIYEWNYISETIHKIDKEKAKTHGVEPEKFLEEFEREVIKYYGDKVTWGLYAIAANAYFDTTMFDNLYKKFKNEEQNIFSHRTIDLTGIAYMLLSTHSFSSTLRKLDIEVDSVKKHNSLYDAHLHLKAFLALRELLKK